MWEAYAFTLMGVVLGQIAPGPNLLAVAGVALGQSRRAAWTVAAGVATAIFVWVVVAALGLASLIALYPALLTLMKLLGGGYLLFSPSARCARRSAAARSRSARMQTL